MAGTIIRLDDCVRPAQQRLLETVTDLSYDLLSVKYYPAPSATQITGNQNKSQPPLPEWRGWGTLRVRSVWIRRGTDLLHVRRDRNRVLSPVSRKLGALNAESGQYAPTPLQIETYIYQFVPDPAPSKNLGGIQHARFRSGDH
jgi:hypothetical protein